MGNHNQNLALNPIMSLKEGVHGGVKGEYTGAIDLFLFSVQVIASIT